MFLFFAPFLIPRRYYFQTLIVRQEYPKFCLYVKRIISLITYFLYKMYSGELEVQAKRKALAVLHDEINRILNSARELSTLTASLIKGDDEDIHACLERMRNAEEEVEN